MTRTPLDRGAVVAFIGTDGAGKTTVIEAVKERLELRNINVAVYHPRAYSSWWTNERLIRAGNAFTDPELQLAIGLETLRQLVWDVAPLRETNDVVLCDRYLHCAWVKALDVVGPNRVTDLMLSLLDVVPQPLLTMWLDVTPEVACERIADRSEHVEGPARFRRLRDGYVALSERTEVVRVDADEDVAAVTSAAMSRIERALRESGARGSFLDEEWTPPLNARLRTVEPPDAVV